MSKNIFNIKFSMYKHITILLYGLISGITLTLNVSTINFWLAKFEIDKIKIGLFVSATALPYAFNFIWMPLLEKIKNRLNVLIILLILLAISLYQMSTLTPEIHLNKIMFWGIMISLFSASKDSILGALRSDILLPKEQGSTSGVYILGYRLGMLLIGPGAIYLSIYIKWQHIYQLLVILIILITILLFKLTIKIQPLKGKTVSSINFLNTVLKPIGTIKIIIVLMLFITIYRMADNLIVSMINPFLLEIGFNEKEIAIGKLLSVISTIFGGLIAGIFMIKISIYQGLKYFAIIHGISYLMFIEQYFYFNSFSLLVITIIVTSLTSGMMFAAYIAFITSLCAGNYKATQYAIFTSMMGVSRVLFSATSGIILHYTGWVIFFLLGALSLIPNLILLHYIKINKTLYS